MFKLKGFSTYALLGVVAAIFILGVFVASMLRNNDPAGVEYYDGASSDEPTTFYFVNVIKSLISGSFTTGTSTSATTTVERFGYGGTVTASSTTSSTGTVTQASLLYSGTYLYTPNSVAVTLTLPASSTLTQFIPNAGDQAEILFRNASSTNNATASYVTLAGGTGTILQSASTTKIIMGGQATRLHFWRSSTSTDVYVIMSQQTN